jgi:predicted nucleotidyltransferase
MIRLRETLELLDRHGVEFVIIGGVAISLHGSSYVTFDLDICYARTPENLRRLSDALAEQHPRLRDLPEALPFVWDERTLRHGTNFTLATDLGEIDLLGEVAGVGTFADALAASVVMSLFGIECRVLSLDALIEAKRAAGRTKDLLILPELEALREATREPDEPA